MTLEGYGERQDYEFLVSNDRKTLTRMTEIDVNKDPYAELMNKIDVKGRQVRGNPNAKVVLVNYDDFQYPIVEYGDAALKRRMCSRLGAG
jgi:hypothetical protein